MLMLCTLYTLIRCLHQLKYSFQNTVIIMGWRVAVGGDICVCVCVCAHASEYVGVGLDMGVCMGVFQSLSLC